MLKFGKLLLVTISFSLLATSAKPYFYPGQPVCPWEKPENTWAKFINRDYSRGGDSFFSVHFIRNIGDIEGGECYSISYHGNENWGGMGKIKWQNNNKNEQRHGGSPTEMKLNVWGAIFTFNEGGEVYYDYDGKLAGNLYCHIGSECWK